jgi:winged helix DNA-binding protein
VVDAARASCGIHAQVQPAAELSLSARVPACTQRDVRDALWRDRTLVKAWTLRGTLHLHPAGELPLWFAARRAISPRAEALGEWRDPQGVVHPPLGAAEVEATRAAVRDALDGACLLREELADEVVRRVGPASRERLRSGFAFFLGETCQGPPRGAKVTFARPDQWLGGWEELDEDEALREVACRYLRTYGPARPRDFATWIGAGGSAASRVRASFGSLALDEVSVEGREAYALEGDLAFGDAKPSLRLLPEYDAYVMGFRERDHLVPGPVRAQVARHGRGRYEGPAGARFVVVDGVAAGVWDRTRRARAIELVVRPVSTLTRALRTAVDAEADRIGRFLGLEPVVTVE